MEAYPLVRKDELLLPVAEEKKLYMSNTWLEYCPENHVQPCLLRKSKRNLKKFLAHRTAQKHLLQIHFFNAITGFVSAFRFISFLSGANLTVFSLPYTELLVAGTERTLSDN